MTEGQATERSDAELIALAQRGESEAFGELYRRYLDPIYRYIRVRVGENRLAEDLSEMVFLRSFESLGKYKALGDDPDAVAARIAELEERVTSGAIDPSPVSGRQEQLENLVNRTLWRTV